MGVGSGVEAVREVVDEDDLTGQRSLDPIAEARRLLQGVCRAAVERSCAELDLYLPLGPGLRAGNRRGARRLADGGQRRRDFCRQGRERQDRDVGRRLCRRRAEQGIERLEQLVGSGDEGDAADAKVQRRRPAARRQRDGVSGLHLQRRGELLVEDDLARLERAAQEAEGADSGEVVGRYSQDRARSGVDRARSRGAVFDSRERRGRGRGRLGDPRLSRDLLRDGLRGAAALHRALPVQRHAPGSACGHRPE